jgi:hypothetical protein
MAYKAIAVSLALLASMATYAQAAEYSRVVCTGEATVATAPDFMEFTLVAVTRAESTSGAVNALQLTEKLLAEQFTPPAAEADPAQEPQPPATLKPAEVIVSGVAITNDGPPVAKRSAMLRFSIDTLRPVEDRLAYVSKVCDKVREVAAAFKCEMKGPFLKVRDEKQHVQAAIYRAAENAYVAGEGAALALRTEVVGVAELKVDSILWDFDREWRAAASDIERVSCKAKVTVIYSLGNAP